MASLTSCAKKFGEFLRPEDKQAIYAGAKRYRAEGMSANQAGLRAIDDQMDVLGKLLNNFAPADSRAPTPTPTLAAKPATKTTSEKDVGLIGAVENAKDDAEYKTAIDELYKQWMDINQEHPEIETYLDAEIGTKPTQRAFSKEWDESEARVEAANREGRRGLKVGQSEAGTQSVVDKETDDALRGLAMPRFRTTSLVAPSSNVTLEQAQKEADRVLATVPNAPTVQVVRTPEDIGVERPAGGIPEGVTLANGDVAIFSDALSTEKDVERVIFHELFHRGLRVVLGDSNYVLTMNAIMERSAKVRQYASAWMASDEGQAVRKQLNAAPGGMTPARLDNYSALAVEEGLARMSEDLMADKTLGSKDMNTVVRAVAKWLAEIAEQIGMKRLAQRIRSMTYDKVEKFVVATVNKSGGAVPENAPGPRFSSGNNPDALYSTAPAVGRRTFLVGMAAALAASPASANVTLGRAKPVSEAVISQRLSPAVEKLLVGNGHGTTNLDGARVIRQALAMISTTGPQELRALAASVAQLMPSSGVAVQVDKGNWTAHGAVEFFPMVRLRLFDGPKAHGMTYDTFLHEALHVVVAARYRSLSTGLLRENDSKIGVTAPAASPALAQFKAVWNEFKGIASPALRSVPRDSETYLSLEQSMGNPDEFFVRALTDPQLQAWMAQQEYRGKTLLERFKDWVKTSLLGMKKEGNTPSWLDAALAASDDVLKAMNGDKPDFERMRAIAGFNLRTSDKRSSIDTPNVLASTRVAGEAALHPATTKATGAVSSFIADAAKEGMVRLAFTKDLVRIAGDHLKTAREYVELMAERGAVKTRYERKVQTILELFEALPSAARGTGAGTVNDFIRQSTSSNKWGYEPAHLPGTQVDADMAVKFKALSAAEQAVVKQVFEHGSTTLADMKAAVLGNMTSDYDLLIAEAKVAGDTTEMASLEKKKIASLRDYTSLMALADGTPYAPLKRFGNHVVVGRSQMLVDAVKAGDIETVKKLELDGAHYFVEFAETKGGAKKIARENEGKYASVEPFEKDSSALLAGRDVLGAFYRLRTIAADSDSGTNGQASKAVNRMVNDLHLVLLSEQSARHAERTRKNIAGADKDMMRAFATQGRATAQFIAALHNNAQVYEQLLAMKKEADSLKPGRGERRMYYNEFMKRHAMGLDYEPSPIADKALAVSSIWLLLTNPAYYLQNATQPLMMSLPAIAGKHGYGRTWGAFTKAYGEVSAVLGKHGLNEDTYAKLPADVRYAVQKLVDQGSIDITLDQEMGQWKSEADSKMKHFDNAVAKLRKVATDLEAINRVVTGVAAYRLDKQNGATEAAAIEYAGRMIYDTHGDYSGANAPRVMRTPLGRVLTQFRKFQLIQISLMAKLASQAFKGASVEERTAGRYALAYTLSHTLAVGGAMALPGFAAIAWIVGTVWPDDDEPDNPELTLRRAIGDNAIADLLLKGVPKLAGVDLSGKLGMGNMLSVSPYSDGGLSREGYAENFTALAGPFLGGLGPKAANAIGLIYNEKEYYKGLEALMPTGLANAAKAGRLMTSGDTTRKGDVALSAEEISVLDGAMVALGLPTNTLTDKQFLQGAKYQTDTFFKERASRVMKQYTEAYRAGDSGALADARQSFQDLQEARLRNGYTRQPLSQLLKAPREQAKREANTAGGVQFRKDNRRFVEETSEL